MPVSIFLVSLLVLLHPGCFRNVLPVKGCNGSAGILLQRDYVYLLKTVATFVLPRH